MDNAEAFGLDGRVTGNEEMAVGMDAGDVKERLQGVIAVKSKRIEELEDAVRAIKDVLVKTGPDSAVAKMIIATCDSALAQLPPIK